VRLEPISILVVDDNRSVLDALVLLLEREGYRVVGCGDGQSAIDRIASERFDLVLTDLRMEPVDGMQVVRAARGASPPIETMVFTAYGSVEAAVEAMRLGALDFLTKPVTADQLLHRVQKVAEGAVHEEEDFLGTSDATQQVRAQAERAAKVRSTVLIMGEIGSGRQHLAHWLHRHGLDADKPLLRMRVGSPVPEAELRAAGTVLVPAFDDWDENAQLALLRSLETLEVGEPPRVIATASPSVEMKVAQGAIRPELYFRLAVLTIKVPPLRDRPKDIEILLQHFLQQFAGTFGRPPPAPTADQIDRLRAHAWPGNVRELVNLAERAVVVGPEAYGIQVKTVPTGASSIPKLTEGFNLPNHLEEIERMLLVRAIEQTGGDRPEMGRLLGLERNTLRYKLNKYSLLD
jgi:DNA-binding NtrC family response regulator